MSTPESVLMLFMFHSTHDLVQTTKVNGVIVQECFILLYYRIMSLEGYPPNQIVHSSFVGKHFRKPSGRQVNYGR